MYRKENIIDRVNNKLMATPGRKRVQPIQIDDDDDIDSNSNEFFIASTSSSSVNQTLQDSLPTVSQDQTLPNSNIKPLVKKTLYVPLNFDELSHIRNVQTNSEFATLLYDFNLYKNVVNGHICFSCRKVNFSLFQPGYRCTICLQRICSKCQRKIVYRQDKICFISLNLLRRSSITPTTLTNQMTIQRTNSDSSTANKSQTIEKKQRSSNSSSCCCIDCYILFDPSTLV